MTQTITTEKQGHMTPLAWDFTPNGLRIWQGGYVIGTIPDNAHRNLTHDLIDRMAERAENDRT